MASPAFARARAAPSFTSALENNRLSLFTGRQNTVHASRDTRLSTPDPLIDDTRFTAPWFTRSSPSSWRTAFSPSNRRSPTQSIRCLLRPDGTQSLAWSFLAATHGPRTRRSCSNPETKHRFEGTWPYGGHSRQPYRATASRMSVDPIPLPRASSSTTTSSIYARASH